MCVCVCVCVVGGGSIGWNCTHCEFWEIYTEDNGRFTGLGSSGSVKPSVLKRCIM